MLWAIISIGIVAGIGYVISLWLARNSSNVVDDSDDARYPFYSTARDQIRQDLPIGDYRHNDNE